MDETLEPLREQIEMGEMSVEVLQAEQDSLQKHAKEEIAELKSEIEEVQESLATESCADGIVEADVNAEWERLVEDQKHAQEEPNSSPLEPPPLPAPLGPPPGVAPKGHDLARSLRPNALFGSAPVTSSLQGSWLWCGSLSSARMPAMSSHGSQADLIDAKAELEVRIQSLESRIAQADADARRSIESGSVDVAAKARAIACLKQKKRCQQWRDRLHAVHLLIQEIELMEKRLDEALGGQSGRHFVR